MKPNIVKIRFEHCDGAVSSLEEEGIEHITDLLVFFRKALVVGGYYVSDRVHVTLEEEQDDTTV